MMSAAPAGGEVRGTRQAHAVVVRGATLHDAYALWLWANDAATRSASFDRDLIEWGVHTEWLRERLSHSSSIVLLAETADARPVGSVRFATDDGWTTARLSYVVAPEARGLGLSRPMVAAAMAHLRAKHPNASAFAEVISSNGASLSVFRGFGWSEDTRPGGVCTFRSHD